MKRGDKNSIKELLESRFKNQKITTLKDFPPPSLFANIEIASKRVAEAIRSSELITVVGDYDVDGVVASVVLTEFLEAHSANYELIIPHRLKDGYGITPSVVERAKGSLIITVDNGIAALSAAIRAKELGKELIITDHHTPQESLPEAFAIVNPKLDRCTYPYKDICGAQVAWYLCASIKEHLSSSFHLGSFLDILSIAIIADVMPLRDINRVTVQKGFLALKTSKRAALEVFRDEVGDEFGYEDLSFLLIPLLNSSGRLDSAMCSFNFLSSKTVSDAKRYFLVLKKHNSKRKEMQNSMLQEAIGFHNPSHSFIVAYKEGWHEGVVGIVSSFLTQKFDKSSFVFALENGIAKGSARSCGRVDIFKTVHSLKDELLKFGGHTKAAGLSLKEARLESFVKKLEEAVVYIDDGVEIGADFEIGLDMVDLELVKILQNYEPYGEGNPKLKFFSSKAVVESIRKIGKDGRSYILELSQNFKKIKTFLFNAENLSYKEGDEISLIYDVSGNYYNKRLEPKIIISKILF
ncbi:MAG: single-stranded-DNA-specific exonuclease RecJ [Campylobacterales bacterium]